MSSSHDIAFTQEEYAILETLCASPKQTSAEDDKRRRAAALATKRTQRYRQRRNDQLTELRQKVKVLQIEYDKLAPKLTAANDSRDGTWKQLALSEKKRWLDAISENNRLKQLLQEQVAFAKFIAAISDTGPPLPFKTRDEWQFLKLTTDPEARIAAIHAIVDREFNVMDSVFIDLGVIDENRVTERISPKMPFSGEIEMYIGACQRMTAPFSLVVDTIWDFIRNPPPNFSRHQCALIEVIDESTLYLCWTYNHAVGDFQFRFIVKRYLEPNKRCVFVSRTILEDEAIPLDQNKRVCNDTGWLEVKAISADKVVVRYCSKHCEGDMCSSAMTMSIYKDLQVLWNRIFEDTMETQLMQLISQRLHV